jgi:hypothetical protein
MLGRALLEIQLRSDEVGRDPFFLGEGRDLRSIPATWRSTSPSERWRAV